MAKGIAFVRFVFFCIFFAIGAGAITLSMLVDPELTRYYRNISNLKQIERGNKRIAKLLTEYNAQIAHIEKDPNVLVNLRTIALGDAPTIDGAVLPRASEEQLAQAREALLQDLHSESDAPPIPIWVQRCTEPRNRKILFVSGAGLTLVTFIFFGTPRHYKPRRRRDKKQIDD